MSSIHDVLFPMRLALGAIGGPERQTEVIALASGREVRNAKWSGSRRRWDVGSAITDLARLQELVSFFEARAGRLFGFRFRDPLDYSSAAPGDEITASDQQLRFGDGVGQAFQLVKHYGDQARAISYPIADTIVVALDGLPVQTGWRFDEPSGQILFEDPPANGVPVSAGFEFDCPVRFEADQIQTVIEAFGAGRIASVGLIEIN
ncbi:MAG: DUF2460 domain-containing protein [Pseudomonadota bacterium]